MSSTGETGTVFSTGQEEQAVEIAPRKNRTGRKPLLKALALALFVFSFFIPKIIRKVKGEPP